MTLVSPVLIHGITTFDPQILPLKETVTNELIELIENEMPAGLFDAVANLKSKKKRLSEESQLPVLVPLPAKRHRELKREQEESFDLVTEPSPEEGAEDDREIFEIMDSVEHKSQPGSFESVARGGKDMLTMLLNIDEDEGASAETIEKDTPVKLLSDIRLRIRRMMANIGDAQRDILAEKHAINSERSLVISNMNVLKSELERLDNRKRECDSRLDTLEIELLGIDSLIIKIT